MTFALAAAMSAAMTVAARPPAPDLRLTVRQFDSTSAAIQAALEGDPILVAFGEWHQTRATAAIPSALRRFTAQILPPLASRLSHLIVETWVTTGRCGEIERAVTDDVQKTTERPPQTENEIETLLGAAVSAGVRPRVLSLTCDDYAAMRPAAGGTGEGGTGEGGTVDYDRTLKITTLALARAAEAALRERRVRSGAPSAGERPLVAIYGGALHNDLDAEPALAAYSFGPGLMAATLGRVVEVDLVVPEYAAGSAAVRAQAWWKAYMRSGRRAGTTVMIRRSRLSFVIVFPPVARTPRPTRPPAR